MSYASKFSKKADVSQLLREAGQLLKEAGGKLVKAAETQEKLASANNKLKQAAQRSKPTVLEPIPDMKYPGKTIRDGLPAPLRRAIEREAGHVEKLLERVKAVPLTKGEKTLQEVKRRKDVQTR